jgi:hypothetical protein
VDSSTTPVQVAAWASPRAELPWVVFADDARPRGISGRDTACSQDREHRLASLE